MIDKIINLFFSKEEKSSVKTFYGNEREIKRVVLKKYTRKENCFSNYFFGIKGLKKRNDVNYLSLRSGRELMRF